MNSIEKAVNQFVAQLEKDPHNGYKSWEHCFSTFQHASEQDIDFLCLHLGFYLASWGMLRGSSFLLKEKSIKFFEKLIDLIVKYKELWEVDVDKYSEKNIQTICEFYEEVKKVWTNDENISQTLITKILMGVYGCVPSFDQFFVKGMRDCYYKMGKFENRLKRVF